MEEIGQQDDFPLLLRNKQQMKIEHLSLEEERDNRLKSLREKIIHKLLEVKIEHLSRDAARGMRIQHHSLDDLERIERLRSLSHRLDCALGIERMDWYSIMSRMRRIWSWVNFMRTDLYRSIELRELEDEASAILNQISVIGEHTVYPPCEIENGRMHLPNSASGTFDRGEFTPTVHIDPEHLVDINQSEISESLMIDSTKNTAEDCTASATLNQRSVVGEHTVYPPCPPCEIENGRMHLPNSASGTFDRGEFTPTVHIDPEHLVDINQSEISESLMIDSTKNTAEDCTASATLNQRSVVGEHTVYPPCPPCEIENGRMHLPNSASGTFDRGEFTPTVHIDPEHLVDINQSEISESLMIDSTKNTAEDCTGNREIGFLLPSYPKAYMCYIRDSLLSIPPKYHMALLVLCGSYLCSEMQTITAPFENFQSKKTTNAPPQQLLLTFGEAFEAFFPEITHITMFLSCIILTAGLSFGLHPGVQIILCMILLIPAIFFCLLELAHNASKTGVACGSIKLPLFWFTTLGAVGISFMFMLATLLLFNISWRLSKGKARVEDLDDASLDVLSEAL